LAFLWATILAPASLKRLAAGDVVVVVMAVDQVLDRLLVTFLISST